MRATPHCAHAPLSPEPFVQPYGHRDPEHGGGGGGGGGLNTVVGVTLGAAFAVVGVGACVAGGAVGAGVALGACVATGAVAPVVGAGVGGGALGQVAAGPCVVGTAVTGAVVTGAPCLSTYTTCRRTFTTIVVGVVCGGRRVGRAGTGYVVGVTAAGACAASAATIVKNVHAL